MPIEFIYFDVGNVLLNFDHRLACRQMAAVSGATPERMWEVVFDGGLKWKYEAGQLSKAEYYRLLCEQAAIEADVEQLDHAGSSIFEINPSMVPVVAGLEAAGYRLGLLSNICESHWAYVSNGRYAIFPDSFDVFALSFRIGAVKPDEQVFRAAIELCGAAAASIFYMDDIAANVEAARAVGIDAVHYTSAPRLVADLRSRGVRFNY